MTSSYRRYWLSGAAAAALVFQLGCSNDCEPVLDCNLKCGAVTDSCGGSADCGPCTEVGIIPEATTCPVGSEYIEIYMDDEDTNNMNYAVGWTGGIGLGPNTLWRFCRVAGTLFGQLPAPNPGFHNDYAVLKLSATCPRDSIEVIRVFDNEDDANQNRIFGNIAPSEQNMDVTTLHFCMFRGGTRTMESFPDLGFPYGVFGAFDITALYTINGGERFVDDEDHNNSNQLYTIPQGAEADAGRIFYDVPNTRVYPAKVR